jgi:1,6-anhydro-N-acetylmuramate kinase
MEEIGLNGDAIEAEAFAFLGIRSLVDLPISFRNTTGVFGNKVIDKNFPTSVCGGVFYKNPS